MGQYIDRHELINVFEVVAKELGAAPMESIASAALRVFRQNCATARTLDVARMVLEMNGKPPTEQWETLRRAAQLICAGAPN